MLLSLHVSRGSEKSGSPRPPWSPGFVISEFSEISGIRDRLKRLFHFSGLVFNSNTSRGLSPSYGRKAVRPRPHNTGDRIADRFLALHWPGCIRNVASRLADNFF